MPTSASGQTCAVVMPEQGSEDMRGPSVTSLNNGLTAESSPEEEAGAVALNTPSTGNVTKCRPIAASVTDGILFQTSYQRTLWFEGEFFLPVLAHHAALLWP